MTSSEIDDHHEFEESRRCLINSYDSHIQNHAGILIAIIIGGIALISEWKNFVINGYWFDAGAIIFVGLLVLVSFGFLYIVSRMSYWTKYSGVALNLSQTDFYKIWSKRKVTDESESKKKPSHTAVIDYAGTHYIFEMIQEKGKTKFGDLDKELVKFAIKVSRSRNPDE